MGEQFDVPSKRSRARFVIKKELQFHFAAAASVLLIPSTVAVWVIICAIFARTQNSAGIAVQFMDVISRARWFIAGFIITDAVAIFVFFLYFSRHVAGPIYRMEKALMDLLQEGSAAPVRLRKHDMLRDMAEIVNRVIERWHNRSRG